MVTFVPLGAGLMTVVASFTRSNREAQSWLSVVMFLPIAPIMFAVVNGTKPTARADDGAEPEPAPARDEPDARRRHPAAARR